MKSPRIAPMLFSALFLVSVLFIAQVARSATWSLDLPDRLDTGIHAGAAVSADFNGDGKADLALTDTGNSKAVVFLGRTPSGLHAWSLEKAGTYALGGTPVAISTGRLFGLTNFDLVTANSGASGSLSLLKGNGNGTFSIQTAIDLHAGYDPASVSVANLGNGHDDVVATVNTAAGAFLFGYLFDGSGGHGSVVPTALASHSLHADSAACGKFDSDSNPDMAVLDHYTDGSGAHNDLSISSGLGNGSFGTAVAAEYPSHNKKIAVGDFNGDGLSDLAILSDADSKFYVYDCVGNDTFTLDSTQYSTPPGPTDMIAADMNNDGKTDLVVASGGTTVSVYLGNGDGTFQARQDKFVPGGAGWLACADMDGDGLLDIITGDAANTNFSVLPGNLKYHLTTAASPAEGGSVSSGGDFAKGAVVNVTATPGANYNFVNWTGPVENANSASTTVTMNADKTVTANFQLKPKNGIKLSKKQAGLVVNLSAVYETGGPVVPDGTTLKVNTRYKLNASDPWPATWSSKTLGKTVAGACNAKPLKAKVGYYQFQALYAPKGQPPLLGEDVIDCAVQPVVLIDGPLDKSVTTNPSPAIQWQAFPGATGYRVETSMSKKFTTLMGTPGYYAGGSTTSGAIPSLAAYPGMKHYWHVVAVLADGTSTSVGSTPRQITYVPPAQ